jgi:uncharacterized glyoxalase superfamily protein PhnB
LTSIEPELWVERAAAAVAFYGRAFGATVELRVDDERPAFTGNCADIAPFWAKPAR